MFLIEGVRSNMLDSRRTVAAPKEATPKTVNASVDCNHKQVPPNPIKKLPKVERISETPIGAIGSIPTKAAIVFGKSNAPPPRSIRSVAAMLGAISAIVSTSFTLNLFNESQFLDWENQSR